MCMAACAAICDGVKPAMFEAEGKLGSKKPCDRCRGRWPGIQPAGRSVEGGARGKFWRLPVLELAPSAYGGLGTYGEDAVTAVALLESLDTDCVR